ncbi:MAG: hypothetical protein JSS44_07840 [Proteobacteria bacterium]|nr:hypothetical protein [Pseudomonadota bacterium]MBS0464191.1 hypothetical protein [Pseudomonadota bacterium]
MSQVQPLVPSPKSRKVFGLLWAFGFGIPIIVVCLRATNLGAVAGYILVVACLLIAWMLNSMVAVTYAISALRHKQRVNAICSFAALACFLAFASCLPQSMYMLNDFGDEVRFFFMRSSLLKEVDAAPRVNGQPKLLVWDTDGMIGAGRGYVYDESDELDLPPSRRSSAWIERADKTELSCGPTLTRPFLRFTGLTSHFFLARFPC